MSFPSHLIHLLLLLQLLLLLNLLLRLQLLLQLPQLIVQIFLVHVDIVVPVHHLVHVVALVLELVHLVPEVVQLVHVEVLHHFLLLLDDVLHGVCLPPSKSTISMVFWMDSEVKATWSRVNCWFI